MSKEQIEGDNSSFGGLLGAISISIGLINAGSIS
jgi:putative membrane protein